mmetsp:Transcript_569/g.857  ORF Transcript_569/g.857 Transcript_569/m.857 type:complete len:435 (-) Transcript_569:1064-2368(-)|eukprot:CAMPEP_0204904186 /NCGR_PEP_ID=MMETSP1397-20131031/4716_1 /ASSEMBLY_ACC=CAM_ASM_000891 /TAXON_ID=49980 /ORGANISM="Climacostomum Climacostomum virens, Strain Stock W-24" /LENGTH=434 /DNA_ID=CAMNT_0052072937 /DNA_START=1209 /DNA_END=2513 /DNA_ORIENTATION=+
MVELTVDVISCQNDSIQGLVLLSIPKTVKAKALVARLVRMEEAKGQILQYVEVSNQVIKKWSDERLLPGEYKFPFPLDVPRGLPGDVDIERRNIKVSVTHWLNVAFLGSSCREVSRRLCISSEYLSEVTVVKSKRSFSTSGCFCFSSSSTNLTTQIPSAATSSDIIKVQIDVDSRSSRQSLKDLTVRLVQRITLGNGRTYEEKLATQHVGKLGKGKRHQVEADLILDKHRHAIESALTSLGRYVKVEYLIKLEGHRGHSQFDFDLGTIFIANFLSYEDLTSPKVKPRAGTRPIENEVILMTESAIKPASSPRNAIKYQMEQDEESFSVPKNCPVDNHGDSNREVGELDHFYREVLKDIGSSKRAEPKVVRPSRISFDVANYGRAPIQRSMSMSEFCKLVELLEEDDVRDTELKHSISMQSNAAPEVTRSSGALA